jgi:short-subunit dehydrogenase
MIYGIKVIAVEPGSVKTEIWEKVEKQDYNLYSNTDYGSVLNNFRKIVLESGRNGISPLKIARTIRKAIEAGRPKTHYPIPVNWLTGWILPSILPDWFIDTVIAKTIGLK